MQFVASQCTSSNGTRPDGLRDILRVLLMYTNFTGRFYQKQTHRIHADEKSRGLEAAINYSERLPTVLFRSVACTPSAANNYDVAEPVEQNA